MIGLEPEGIKPERMRNKCYFLWLHPRGDLDFINRGKTAEAIPKQSRHVSGNQRTVHIRIDTDKEGSSLIQAIFQAVEQCLLEQDMPSETLQAFMKQGTFDIYPFQMLRRQQFTEQSRIHHPEGNVWNHTLLVVDHAAQRKAESTDPRAFMWAALLHDIGKPATTKIRNGKITAYDHDKIGADLAKEFLSVFTEDTDFIARVSGLVRYHMQLLFVIKELPFQDIAGMKKHVSIHDVALLGLCDRLGRTGAQEAPEEKNVERFLEKCSLFP